MASASDPVVPRGLVFTHDGLPGYRRVRRGKGFSFYLPDGTLLEDVRERRRLQALAIPPAYRSVWICTDPRGHLQATGIDDRGRKQYRYHPDWQAWAGARKFEHLLEFAAALPRLRRAACRLLDRPDLSKERIVAGVVALLDRTGYRIGNARYCQENGSYGLASLLADHAEPDGDRWRLRFSGKSGRLHEAVVEDPRLIGLINELHELPGQHLFRYEDESGEWHDLGTAEVNEWLKETGGGDFTAKEFRTWRATVLCARELGKQAPPDTKTGRTRARNAAIRATAALLNHRPATCRKYYIHPAVFAAFDEGELFRAMRGRAPKLRRRDQTANLRADERRVFRLLEKAGAAPTLARQTVKEI